MEKLLKELLEANRHQRHDFLNHLQVIWGFIKIKKEDKAIEYIQTITDYLQSLRELNNIVNAELAADISAKVLQLGLQKGFRVSVPEPWNIGYENIPKVRDFLNELWGKLVETVIVQETYLKLKFTDGKIILDVHNINEEFSWEIYKLIGEKHEIKTQIQENILTYLIEG
ncbi:MAG: Spo0B domain-containing protein [Peptococcales bacterium]|jgi:hypothetical protein